MFEGERSRLRANHHTQECQDQQYPRCAGAQHVRAYYNRGAPGAGKYSCALLRAAAPAARKKKEGPGGAGALCKVAGYGAES